MTYAYKVARRNPPSADHPRDRSWSSLTKSRWSITNYHIGGTYLADPSHPLKAGLLAYDNATQAICEARCEDDWHGEMDVLLVSFEESFDMAPCTVRYDLDEDNNLQDGDDCWGAVDTLPWPYGTISLKRLTIIGVLDTQRNPT